MEYVLVKSPSAAFGFILRRCGVRKSTTHSSGIACLASGAFYKAVCVMVYVLVKSPSAAFGFILRRCGVRKSTTHSSGIACLAFRAFYKAALV